MGDASMTAALQQVSRLFREGTLNALSDDRLLDRFLDDGDEDAFAALVARHGPTVLRACLDVLRDPGDAEDAFQATFLTLVRRAGSIRGRDRVGAWLRRVAHRSALRANADPLRRRARERIAASRAASPPGSSVGAGLDRSELDRAIRAEIDRLPEPYRRPVVLCLVEGLPQPEAAGRLCVTEGVVRGRLARARALLRDRLTRRGVAPDQSTHTFAPVVPAAWVGSVVAAARVLNAGRAARLGWAGMSAVVSAALVVMAGAWSLATGLPQAPPKPPLESPAPRPELTASAPPVAVKPASDSGRTVVLRGKVLGLEGRPVAGARLFLAADAWANAEERGSSGADGSYRIELPEATFRRNFTFSNTSPRVQIALIATADGYGPAWEQIQAGARDGLPAMRPEYAHDLRLVADRPIGGRVVDADGKPIPKAIVEVVRIRTVNGGDWKPILGDFKNFDTGNLWNGFSYVNPSGTWKVLPPAVSDPDGRFRLSGVGCDRMIDLRVTGPGVRPTELSVMTLDDVADVTRALRARYPRRRDPSGFYYTNYNTPREIRHAVMVFDPSPTVEVERARTVSGVVRDARTGEPIPRMRLAVTSRSGGSGQIDADDRGRYRGTRDDHESSVWVYAISDQPDRYLSAVREFNDAKGLGEIVADFAIEPGVTVTGRVLEAGTDRPIVSSVQWECHDPEGRVVAGRVEYFPLASNTALRATPTGLYFAGPPLGQNRSDSTWIDGDGRFRMVVPPGPGVLLIRAAPGLPLFGLQSPVLRESEEIHRLFPYVPLTARATGDGAPGDDPKGFPGFNGVIPLSSYHAYQVINPPADAAALAVELTIPRAPSQLLRFVGPDGRPVRGLTVAGLLAPPLPMTTLDGSEAEALALDPSRPRPLLALSHDGLYFARDVLEVTGPLPMPPKTIVLGPASSVSGRLLDAATGRPLSGCTVSITYQTDDDHHIPRVPAPLPADVEGRFVIRGLIPDLPLSVSFQEPPHPLTGPSPAHRPDSLGRLTLGAREDRDLGDLRISTQK